MILRPPRSTRTDTLFPSTTLFRSTVRLALDAAYDSPHRFQPADMGFGECLAGTRIMLQMRIDIVAPLVRHSDLRDRPVDLSHPPCARHYAHDRVALQWLVRLALPDRKSTRLNSSH